MTGISAKLAFQTRSIRQVRAIVCQRGQNNYPWAHPGGTKAKDLEVIWEMSGAFFEDLIGGCLRSVDALTAVIQSSRRRICSSTFSSSHSIWSRSSKSRRRLFSKAANAVSNSSSAYSDSVE